ncbi:MAG: pirin family protein, partial [Fischerella sp.]|nr:pirin family protein [Fischerella sp.]
MCIRDSYYLKPQRYAWVQIAQGVVTLNGHSLKEGDGAAVNGEEQLEISTDIGAEVLLFDLA